MWKGKIQPNWRVFVWRIINKALDTKDNLNKRSIQVDSSCVFCLRCEESCSHSFRDCQFVGRIWKASQLGINVMSAHYIDISEWIKNFLMFFWKEDGQDSQRVLAFVAVLWAIWLQRNNIVFRNNHPDPEQVIASSQIFIRETVEAQRMYDKILHRRMKSETNLLVLKGNYGETNVIAFVDGAWKRRKKSKQSVAAIGWTLEVDGRRVTSDAYRVKARNAGQAEMKAILAGMKKVVESHIQSVTIYTDCSNSIKALKDYSCCKIKVATICSEIRCLAVKIQNCIIVKS